MGSFRNVKKAGMVAAVLLLLTLSLGGAVASKSNDQAATYENLRLFTEVLSIIQSQYVDEMPPKELIYSAIKGTLRGLDAHSSFLDPDMYREMQVETSGSFGGLGIEITLRDDILTVVTPIEGTPAYRAGIQPGDRIVKIEGISTKDMAEIQVVDEGEGIPAATREKLFTPFFTTKDRGLGLGLALCHRIVEEHKGAMQVTSEPAHGTAFSCFLPITK